MTVVLLILALALIAGVIEAIWRLPRGPDPVDAALDRVKPDDAPPSR